VQGSTKGATERIAQESSALAIYVLLSTCPPGLQCRGKGCVVEIWYYFWTSSFILAGTAFVIIAVIVLVRGIADMRQMFSKLETQAASRQRKEP
jgi:hypothetical protein